MSFNAVPYKQSKSLIAVSLTLSFSLYPPFPFFPHPTPNVIKTVLSPIPALSPPPPSSSHYVCINSDPLHHGPRYVTVLATSRSSLRHGPRYATVLATSWSSLRHGPRYATVPATPRFSLRHGSRYATDSRIRSCHVAPWNHYFLKLSFSDIVSYIDPFFFLFQLSFNGIVTPIFSLF